MTDDKRARTEEGKFVADNPDTPFLNEAYAGAEARKSRASENMEVLNFRDLRFPVDRSNAYQPIRDTVRAMSNVMDEERLADMVETLATCAGWLVRRVEDNRMTAAQRQKEREIRAEAAVLKAAEDELANKRREADEQIKQAKRTKEKMLEAEKRLTELMASQAKPAVAE